MALELNQNVKGYDYQYWKVIKVEFDVFGDTVITLGLFKDADASALLDNLVTERKFSVRWAKDVFTTENILRCCYEFVKTQSVFTAAKDV